MSRKQIPTIDMIGLETAQVCRIAANVVIEKPHIAALAITNMIALSGSIAVVPAAFDSLTPRLRHDLVDLASDARSLTGAALLNSIDKATVNPAAAYVVDALTGFQAILNRTDIAASIGTDDAKRQQLRDVVERCGSGFESLVNELGSLGLTNQLITGQGNYFVENINQTAKSLWF